LNLVGITMKFKDTLRIFRKITLFKGLKMKFDIFIGNKTLYYNLGPMHKVQYLTKKVDTNI